MFRLGYFDFDLIFMFCCGCLGFFPYVCFVFLFLFWFFVLLFPFSFGVVTDSMV